MNLNTMLLAATALLLAGCASARAANDLTWEATRQDRKQWTLAVPKAPDEAEAKKIALGKQLFSDSLLSADNSLSCASCHLPEHAFSDPRQVSKGVGGKTGRRHALSCLNLVEAPLLFWDGRAKSLEEQVAIPMTDPAEMSLPVGEAIKRLNSTEKYAAAFKDCFGVGPAADKVAMVIAAYERQLYSHNSPFDKWVAGDENAMSNDAKRGFALFVGKASCMNCHKGPNFTDGKFYNLGVGMDKPKADMGRFEITKIPAERGSFRTPGLREIANCAPYMHDGSEQTLEAVVEYYDRGGTRNPWLSPQIKPLKLTAQEKTELVQFMKALSGEIHAP